MHCKMCPFIQAHTRTPAHYSCRTAYRCLIFSLSVRLFMLGSSWGHSWDSFLKKSSVANQAVAFRFLLKTDATKVYWHWSVPYLKARTTVILGFIFTVFEKKRMFITSKGTHNKNNTILSELLTTFAIRNQIVNCHLGGVVRRMVSWDEIKTRSSLIKTTQVLQL